MKVMEEVEVMPPRQEDGKRPKIRGERPKKFAGVDQQVARAVNRTQVDPVGQNVQVRLRSHDAMGAIEHDRPVLQDRHVAGDRFRLQLDAVE